MARGSLLFDANGEYANYAAAAAINDVVGGACTILAWIRIATDGFNRTILGKAAAPLGAGGTGFWFLVDGQPVSPFTGRGYLRLVRGGATDADYTSSANRVLASTGWAFVAAACSSFGTAGGISLYYGSLTARAVVETAYTTSVDGSGSYNTDAGQAMRVGNLNDGNNPLQGRAGIVALFASKFSSSDIISWQLCPRKTVGSATAVMFSRCGKDGADAIDYTGLSPTVTNATQDDGVPLDQTWARDGNSSLYLRAA